MYNVLSALHLPRVCLANTEDLNGSARTIVQTKSLISDAAPHDFVVLKIYFLVKAISF